MASINSIDQFAQQTKLFLSTIGIELSRINEIVANDAATIIKNRVIETGINGSGKQLGTYSEPYQKKRDNKGYLNTFVNLQFTGEMWKDIGVKNTTVIDNNIVTIVTAKSDLSNDKGVKTSDKMGFNAERYGDFLSINSKEEELLVKVFDAELQKVVDKFFE